MDKALRIYAWFLLVVTTLPAAARLLRPVELARIVLMRYQNPKRRKRARIGGIAYLIISVFIIPFLIVTKIHQERWLIMAVWLGRWASSECWRNSRVFTENELARQNRLFGGAYAAIAIATALLLFTR